MNCPNCGLNDQECWCYWEFEPEPTYEEYCDYTGHPYYDDEYNWEDAPEAEREQARLEAGRCYCGYKRYEAGNGNTNADNC